ncbi:MAG: hypothetical protein NVS4B7_16590 [Ktedonobacteraceae bacterium]
MGGTRREAGTDDGGEGWYGGCDATGAGGSAALEDGADGGAAATSYTS